MEEPIEAVDADETFAETETAAPLTEVAFVPASIVVGSWAGHPNYKCSDCGFALLDRAKVERHLRIHGKTETRS
jgi:hypothetical protein